MMNDRFLKACRREPVDQTPVWFMRQAGRYMAEYQAIRRRHSILEICKTPELAAEVTLQPISRFNVDAAIIFADILLPLDAMGLGLEFIENQKRNGCKVQNLAILTNRLTDEETEHARRLGCHIFWKPLKFDEIGKWLDDCERKFDTNIKLSDLPIRKF